MIDRVEQLRAPGADATVQALILHSSVPRPARWERIAELVVVAGTRPRTLRGLGLATLVAITAVLAGIPWLSVGVIGAGTIHYVVAAARETRRGLVAQRALGPFGAALDLDVEPDEIASLDLRATYLGILQRHEDLRLHLIDAPRMQQYLRDTFERCGATVHVAGRLARLANPLDGYLQEHSAERVTRDLDELAARVATAGDPAAVAAYRRAAAARGRQLGTLLEIKALRDRIRARLELVSASLDSIVAAVVKLQVLDLAQIELVGESMADELSALGEELAILEAMMDDGAAAVAASGLLDGETSEAA